MINVKGNWNLRTSAVLIGLTFSIGHARAAAEREDRMRIAMATVATGNAAVGCYGNDRGSCCRATYWHMTTVDHNAVTHRLAYVQSHTHRYPEQNLWATVLSSRRGRQERYWIAQIGYRACNKQRWWELEDSAVYNSCVKVSIMSCSTQAIDYKINHWEIRQMLAYKF